MLLSLLLTCTQTSYSCDSICLLLASIATTDGHATAHNVLLLLLLLLLDRLFLDLHSAIEVSLLVPVSFCTIAIKDRSATLIFRNAAQLII